jgi:hypothetical protein
VVGVELPGLVELVEDEDDDDDDEEESSLTVRESVL